jgi:hypothetical protein
MSGTGPFNLHARPCGILTETEVSVIYENEAWAGRIMHLNFVTGLCAIDGDSGGPMWSSNTAWMIASGGWCNSISTGGGAYGFPVLVPAIRWGMEVLR